MVIRKIFDDLTLQWRVFKQICSIRKRPDQTSVCAQREDRMEVSVIRRRVCFCSHNDDDDEYKTCRVPSTHRLYVSVDSFFTY